MVTNDLIVAIELGSSKLAGAVGRKQSDGSLQVLAYASALERIYEKPVKASLLYFFRLGEFVPVK